MVVVLIPAFTDDKSAAELKRAENTFVMVIWPVLLILSVIKKLKNHEH